MDNLFLIDSQGNVNLRAQPTLNLPTDTTQWGQTILDEALKASPFLSNYNLDIDLDVVDEGKGYAVGSVKVTSKTKPGKAVALPVICQKGKLFPLDVFVTKEGFYAPLDETGLNRVLIDPSVSKGVGVVDGENNITDMTFPPSDMRHTNYMVKSAMLQQILPTISEKDVVSLGERLKDPHIARGLSKYAKLIQPLFLPRADLMKTAAAAIPPTVIQVKKADHHYMVKCAHHLCFPPQVGQLDNLKGLTISETTQQEIQSGRATIVHCIPTTARITPEPSLLPVEREGVYPFIKEGSQKPVAGYVFSNIVSLPGLSILPAKMVIGQDFYSMQEKVAAVKAFDPIAPPVTFSDTISGTGCFFFQGHTQGDFVTEPLKIVGHTKLAGTKSLVAETLWGEQLKLHLIPQAATFLKTAQREFVLPEGVKWISLSGKPQVKLAMSQQVPVDYTTAAKFIYNGDYSLQGTPFKEVTASNLTREEAEFLCAAAGMGAPLTKVALDMTRQYGSLMVDGLRKIETQEHTQGAFKKEAARLHQMVFTEVVQSDETFPITRTFTIGDLKQDLVKEAAELINADSVDAVLSLHFINPDNVAAFIENLPYFRLTQHKLAELLVAVRLGQTSPPEDAVKRALFALTDVIHKLEVVQHDIKGRK